MSECSICLEKFNKSLNKKIDCKTCEDNEDTKVCISCAGRYILENCKDAKCMVCNIEWDKEFMSDYFTKKFIDNDYKYHQEQYLYDEQIARLPDTQNMAVCRKKQNELKKQLNLIKKEKEELMTRLRDVKNVERNIIINIEELESNKVVKESVKFTFKCPLDDCKGFLNENYHCHMCSQDICKYCMEELTENHKCNNDKKQTVELLRKDTKPCPKCGQLIYKIDGCNQMWCLKCHTAFDWRTGNIDESYLHNPEYFRWMRENNKVITRNPLDLPNNNCNFPTFNIFINIINFYFPNSNFYGLRQKSDINKLSNIFRLVLHIQNVTLVRNIQQQKENNLQELRIKYLINEIDKESFKKNIQKVNKQFQKSQRINNIWNLVNTQYREYILDIINSTKYYSINKAIENIKNIIEEADNVKQYANTSFYKVGKLFKMSYPKINDDFIEIPNWEYYKKHNKN